MSKIDIMIPTYYADFIWAEYCLKSVKQYATGFRNVILVSDNDGHQLPQSITQIMPIIVKYIDVPAKMPPNLQHRPGYLWQQILKLNWMDYTDADAVLILDSDEMLSCPVTPRDFRDDYGRFRYSYRSWEFADDAIVWKKPTTEILGFEPEYEAMCVAGFIFERKTTYNFIEYLKKIHNATDLWNVFFKYDMTLFSEYNAYGSYVNKYDNNTVYYKVINSNERFVNHGFIKSWSYGGLSDDDKNIRDNLLL